MRRVRSSLLLLLLLSASAVLTACKNTDSGSDDSFDFVGSRRDP